MASFDLLLMRHGDADMPSGVADINRSLSKKGRQEVQSISAQLVSSKIDIQSVHVSVAQRTRDTAAILEASLGLDLSFKEGLYLAEPDRIEIEAASALSTDSVVLVIGHNPGLSLFISELTNSYIGVGTAQLYWLRTQAEDAISAFAAGQWEIVKVLRPSVTI